ncbi:MAG: DoxX family protein [Moraxellaceae bacterium]|nr:DoxX family protein [Moraxellaceae bacterium]
MEFFRNINRHVIGIVSTPALNAALIIVARVLMAWIFIGAGLSKLGAGYAGTQGYMASVGLPGELLPLVILLEIGGGIALVLGFQARLAALALAIFSIVSAFMFHGAADQMQQIMFMKNLAMAGGLLAFTVFGAGRLSLDGEQR